MDENQYTIAKRTGNFRMGLVDRKVCLSYNKPVYTTNKMYIRILLIIISKV